MMRREIRDPIHGFINRSEIEQQIIDTKVFQRLRRIKQLAMAFLAYPGAMHTRFEHSLGVMHVAGRLAKSLSVDEEEKELVRIAALLHDIGHGPFSHVSEDILGRYFDPEKIEIKEKIHEQITRDIISSNPELAQIMSERERDKIISILSGDLCDPLVKGIVSGPLDADKQDYLLRDSYYCGVKYGVFDIERMIGTIEKYKGNDENSLAVSLDGIHTLEQYIMAKYHMTTQVYRHKVRLVSDAMIVRAIELGIDIDKLDWLINLYKYDGTDKFIHNYLEWDDNRLTVSLLYPLGKEGYATDLFRKLNDRKLFKRIFSKPLRKPEFEDPEIRDFLSNINENTNKKEIEAALADNISSKLEKTAIDPNYLIIKSMSIKSVRVQSRDNEEYPIMIISHDTPQSFENESTLFRSINKEEHDLFIEVYAPIIYSNDHEKQLKLAKCESIIHEFFIGKL